MHCLVTLSISVREIVDPVTFTSTFLLSNYRLSLFVCNDSSRLLLINYNNCINGIQPLSLPPGHFPHPDISHHLPNPLRDNSTPDISPHSTNYPI